MKIYDIPGFPNPLRIRIVLAEKRLTSEVEFVKVDLPAAEHKQPAFLAINPTGTVPVLQLDDGTFISECTAITEYLDNLDGKPVLTGANPKQKAIIHMMQKRAESELIDAIGFYFHHSTPGLGDTLRHYKYPDWSGRAEWGNLQREKAVAGMHYFNSVLGSRPFIAGESFSMADITVWAGLLFAGFAGIALPAECTDLSSWHARISDHPSVKSPA
ncbi:glutathione S-transferase family protein [Paraburkholderia fynbosensis]|uniref:Glutathione S-transferase GST-6.0 n=1 Tax=Paraburkholderia fynbosensis TaxID=1200993 RepID=A0A6J5H5G8_9BURK|nr:glutathione S-transferase [Paraburkholderia fynbosensis]CAB3810894.1 Glutathione S-transferase GST-6.0 [Paraburkholderia fynbosensis]